MNFMLIVEVEIKKNYSIYACICLLVAFSSNSTFCILDSKNIHDEFSFKRNLMMIVEVELKLSKIRDLKWRETS